MCAEPSRRVEELDFEGHATVQETLESAGLWDGVAEVRDSDRSYVNPNPSIDDEFNVSVHSGKGVVTGRDIPGFTLDLGVAEFSADDCRVYWGSHGCKLKRGHPGPHRCDCADDPDFDPVTKEYRSDPGVFNVGAPPYYGPETRFYGEDVLEGPEVEPL